MRFRPCIDIHNGKVKQIVGGTLSDRETKAEENFVAEQDGAYFANLYRERGLSGGHIILLNLAGSKEYALDLRQAKSALGAFPGGMQIGGGVTADNAADFLEYGASHVIVTSYVFKEGHVWYDRLQRLVNRVGKEHIVLDLSCRIRDGKYYIVTDRWQVFTEEEVTPELLKHLEMYCDEFLVHAVDVEGKAGGIDETLVRMLGAYDGLPVTYAGGVRETEDLKRIYQYGKGKVDVTIGSALDLFGGHLSMDDIAETLQKLQKEG